MTLISSHVHYTFRLQGSISSSSKSDSGKKIISNQLFTRNEELERPSKISKCEGKAMANESLGKSSHMKATEVRRDVVVEVQGHKPTSWPSDILPCQEEPIIRQIQ